MGEAIEFHLEGLREEGHAIPDPIPILLTLRLPFSFIASWVGPYPMVICE